MTVTEYRKKYKRCRFCKYTRNNVISWTCMAQNKTYSDVNVSYTRLKGMFCPLYQPKELKE